MVDAQAAVDGIFPSVFRSIHVGKWNEVPKWSGVTVSQLTNAAGDEYPLNFIANLMLSASN